MPIQQAAAVVPYQGPSGSALLQQQQQQKQAQAGQTVGDLSKIGGLLASFIPIVGPILGPLLGMAGSAAGGAIAQDRSATDEHMKQAQSAPIQATQIGSSPQQQPQQNDINSFLSSLGQGRMS